MQPAHSEKNHAARGLSADQSRQEYEGQRGSLWRMDEVQESINLYMFQSTIWQTGEPAATTVTTGSQSKEDDSFVKYTENANHPKGLRGTEEDRPWNGLYSAGIAEDGEK